MSTRVPPSLRVGSAESAQVDPAAVERAVGLVRDSIAHGEIPGAVVAVARHGTLFLHEALGWAATQPELRPMQLDTRFDLASLTKVTATVPAVLHLVEQGAFRLDDRVHRFFPAFTGGGKESVTIRHLLTHTAGLAPWLPLELEPGTRPEYIQRILVAPLQQEPGRSIIYSDLGFILLGELVHLVSGKPLDQYATEFIFRPHGLDSLCFNPAPEIAPTCAATEYRPALGRYQVGEVHDERATCLEGVAGHAGLFGTAVDICAYGQLWLKGLLAPATLAAATRIHAEDEGDCRGLGWIILRPKHSLMSCGDLFTPGAFGHTGFTGTSLWIDPATGLSVALLTNRVHFGRESDAIIRLRPRFHNAIAAALR
jgi:CubicO group peptidase (beta-lactamase class C family)